LYVHIPGYLSELNEPSEICKFTGRCISYRNLAISFPDILVPSYFEFRELDQNPERYSLVRRLTVKASSLLASLKTYKINGYFTFLIVSCSVLRRVRNIADKVEEKKHAFYIQKHFFFRKSCRL